MEEFSVNSYALSPKRTNRTKWYSLVLGTSWLMVGLIGIFSNKVKTLYYLYLFSGLIMIFVYQFTSKVSNKYNITINDRGIFTHTTLFKKFNVNWKQIKSVNISVLEIKIYLKDESEKIIDLSYLDYLYVQTVKEKMKEFASDKNIEIS